MAPPRYDVLGTWIDAVDPEATVAEIRAWIAARERRYVCVANVHGVTEARRDLETRLAFSGAGLVVPDGMPLVWLARLHGHRQARRVYGPDLTLLLCEAAAREGWRLYFYGGEEGVAAALAREMARRFPGLVVAGAHGPPFRPLDAAELEAEVAVLNASGATLVFVGLGCPKQERWMAEHRNRLTAPVLLGVGAAFDFLTGRVRQAPRWMMRAGLEWLFRLSREPRRLWRRYLVLNTLFVGLLLRDLATGGRRRPRR